MPKNNRAKQHFKKVIPKQEKINSEKKLTIPKPAKIENAEKRKIVFSFMPLAYNEYFNLIGLMIYYKCSKMYLI